MCSKIICIRELNVPGYPTVIAYKNGQKIVPNNYRSLQGLTNFIEEQIVGR